MSMVKGLAMSAAGGLLGAAVWAGVAFGTGYEFGILAWLVGGMAGLGMYMGADQKRTRLTGVAAAAIALMAVLGGKFAAVSLYIDRMIAAEEQVAIDDEVAQDYLRSQIYDEMLTQQSDFTWPDGVDADDAMEQGMFPLEVTTAAARRWGAMDEATRTQFKSDLQATSDADRRHAQGVLTGLAFVFSFGLFDLLFVGLAVSSAYKFGAAAPTSKTGDEASLESYQTPISAPAPLAGEPLSGPLARVPGGSASAGGSGDPAAPRPNEPPLVIKRKEAA